MRIPLLARLIAVLSLSLAGLTVATAAHAEEEFDVSVAGGHLVVKAKGGWHINKEYPWRLVIGDKTIDKSKFTLSDTSAVVDVSAGTVTLKGGVCNGDQCVRLDKSITVP